MKREWYRISTRDRVMQLAVPTVSFRFVCCLSLSLVFSEIDETANTTMFTEDQDRWKSHSFRITSQTVVRSILVRWLSLVRFDTRHWMVIPIGLEPIRFPFCVDSFDSDGKKQKLKWSVHLRSGHSVCIVLIARPLIRFQSETRAAFIVNSTIENKWEQVVPQKYGRIKIESLKDTEKCHSGNFE